MKEGTKKKKKKKKKNAYFLILSIRADLGLTAHLLKCIFMHTGMKNKNKSTGCNIYGQCQK